jgi:hypothetical protein
MTAEVVWVVTSREGFLRAISPMELNGRWRSQPPRTAPRMAGLIRGVFSPKARDGRAGSAGCLAEGKWRETGPRARA